jgi:hypothetical protein
VALMSGQMSKGHAKPPRKGPTGANKRGHEESTSRLAKSPQRAGVKPSDTCIEARQPWPFCTLVMRQEARSVPLLTDEAAGAEGSMEPSSW